jgi:AmmeMemoRadiSam system protein B
MRPVRDDVGFCWRAVEMDSLVSFLARNDTTGPGSGAGVIMGGISPHDDYLYAGAVYYPLFKRIRAREIVIFGLTHGSVRKEVRGLENVLVLDEFDMWQGPYGPVAVSPLRSVLRQKLAPSDYVISNKAHTLEHSVEALIPFCQYFNREALITPILVGAMDPLRMEEVSSRFAEVIVSYMADRRLRPGEDIVVLISNDANHYGPDFHNTAYGVDENGHRLATENDRRIVTTYLEGTLERAKIHDLAGEIRWDTTTASGTTLWCGRYPVVFGMLTLVKTSEKLNKGRVTGSVFMYSDTWTGKVLPVQKTSMGLTAPYSLKHWVGFFSAGFVLGGVR